MKKRCCVVGAGVSGLTSVKHCLDEGIEPTCFDKDDDIGGLWNYKDESRDGYPSLYDSCSLNTSKEMTCFSDFPFPREFPNFMHHSQFKAYLGLYATNFGLRKYIKLKTCVTRVEKADNFDDSGQWVVTYTDARTDKERREKFDYVMVCNGHLTEPNTPQFPGIDKFKGKVLHTRDFKDFRGYENKNILVIGIANSAADVACELSQHAKHVYVSTRRGTYVIQRAADYGVPYDQSYFTRFRHLPPPSLMLPLYYNKINSRYRHRNYGLSPNHRIESARPTISDDLPNRILLGTISVHENVRYFTDHGAVFEDDSKVDDIDVVIFATGFNISFPFLDPSVIKQDGHFAYLYKQVWPTGLHPCTLAVIGLVQPFGSLPPVLEIQARWATRVFAGRNKLPSPPKRLEVFEVYRDFIKKTYIESARYTILIGFVQYIDEIGKFIGCRPNLWKLFLKNPKLWYRVYFCGATPPQWRLVGPGKWAGATKAIMDVDKNTWYPMQTRKSGEGETAGLYEGWINLLKKIIIIGLFMVLMRLLFTNWY